MPTELYMAFAGITSQRLNAISTFFLMLLMDVENETKFGLRHSTQDKIDTKWVSNVATTLSQRCFILPSTLFESYIETNRASHKYGFIKR